MAGRREYTLTELLAVMLIVLILAALLLPGGQPRPGKCASQPLPLEPGPVRDGGPILRQRLE